MGGILLEVVVDLRKQVDVALLKVACDLRVRYVTGFCQIRCRAVAMGHTFRDKHSQSPSIASKFCRKVHDIRNNVNIILLNSKMLLDENPALVSRIPTEVAYFLTINSSSNTRWETSTSRPTKPQSQESMTPSPPSSKRETYECEKQKAL